MEGASSSVSSKDEVASPKETAPVDTADPHDNNSTDAMKDKGSSQTNAEEAIGVAGNTMDPDQKCQSVANPSVTSVEEGKNSHPTPAPSALPSSSSRNLLAKGQVQTNLAPVRIYQVKATKNGTDPRPLKVIKTIVDRTRLLETHVVVAAKASPGSFARSPRTHRLR